MTDLRPPLPSLHYNGAVNPDQWKPSHGDLRDGTVGGIAEEGDLVAWRYGGWRVLEAKPVPDADVSDDEMATMRAYVERLHEPARARVWAYNRPRITVLVHESGPLILKPGEAHQVLHDGRRTVHYRSRALDPARFNVLKEPHRVCSCHHHIWPCQEFDQMVLAAHQARHLDGLVATAEPGVCAHCLELISTRQKVVTFPEPSRLVPGAPGPTFHAGRSECWKAAEDYERRHRLRDNPDIGRLASCPGIRFVHEGPGAPADQRLECTAGPACTGLHGPSGHRKWTDTPCWMTVTIAGNEGAYARPSFDCGFDRPDHRGNVYRCIGGDLTGGGSSITPIAADLLWQQEERQRRGHL